MIEYGMEFDAFDGIFASLIFLELLDKMGFVWGFCFVIVSVGITYYASLMGLLAEFCLNALCDGHCGHIEMYCF